MAIDDVKFTNLRGEEISRTNLVQEMIKYYQLKVDNNESKITDFNEGSEIRNLMESFAVDIYYLMEMENDILKNCFIDTATRNWLDRIGMHPFIQIERNKGSPAKGQVTFSIPTTLTTEVQIPEATILLSDNNKYYTTDSECIIPIGETSNTTNITCITVGSDGNCGSGSITTFDDSFNNLNMVSVTNESAVSDGEDYEDDETYRQRLLDFVRRDDFGSLGYYRRLCEGVAGVHDVELIDVAGYTKKVLVNGTTKPTPDSVLLDVLTVLSDLGNTVVGHSFSVDKPTFDTVNLSIAITVNAEMDTDIVKHIVEDLLDGGSRVEGFEFNGLNISQGVTQQELYGLFDMIDNITNVTITSGGSPVTSLPCTTNHVLKAGTITVTQTVG